MTNEISIKVDNTSNEDVVVNVKKTEDETYEIKIIYEDKGFNYLALNKSQMEALIKAVRMIDVKLVRDILFDV